MRRGFLGLVAAASLALPAAAVTPAAHAAAPTPTLLSISVSPAATVINSTDTRHVTITATTSMPLQDLAAVAKDVNVADGGFDLGFDDPADDGLTWVADVKVTSDRLFGHHGEFQLQSLEGSWYEGGVDAYSTNYHSDEPVTYGGPLPSFSVKRQSSLSGFAAPRTIRKGKTSVIYGELLQFEGYGLTAQRYTDYTVTVQRQTPGQTRWIKVRTISTAATAGLTLAVKPAATMRYRLVFAGTGGAMPATSKTFTVTVKR